MCHSYKIGWCKLEESKGKSSLICRLDNLVTLYHPDVMKLQYKYDPIEFIMLQMGPVFVSYLLGN